MKDLKEIGLIVFDFDGVMTDNRVILNQYGEEAVVVNRADGLGVALLRQRNIPMLILSGEENPVVTARAGKLEIPVLQGVREKAPALKRYLEERGIDPGRVVYVGNDVNDLEAMLLVGFKVAPADAHRKVREIADLVLEAGGGEGVVRELADLLLDAGVGMASGSSKARG